MSYLSLYVVILNFFFSKYRPVSILFTLSKVFEKIMYNRLLNYLDHNKILFSY